MSGSSHRIGVRKAAQLIFRVRQPTAEQLSRIRQLLTRGDLQPEGNGTTMESVAELMARVALRGVGPSDKGSPADFASEILESPGSRSAFGGESLRSIYRESLKEYFLAVFFRRRRNDASVGFQRAVVAGQAIVLLMFALFVVGSVRAIFAPMPPEKSAVLDWLDKNTHHFRIIQWHPAAAADDGNGMTMRVQYHYVTRHGRGIDTDRVFTIQAGRVVRVDSEW